MEEERRVCVAARGGEGGAVVDSVSVSCVVSGKV